MRVAQLKPATIPSLELTATVVLAKLVNLVQCEILEKIESVYHTDSTKVLTYISNEQGRFPFFVANRVRIIRDLSCPSQWKTCLLRWTLRTVRDVVWQQKHSVMINHGWKDQFSYGCTTAHGPGWNQILLWSKKFIPPQLTSVMKPGVFKLILHFWEL